MADYTYLGLNKRLQKINSLPDRAKVYSGVQFESQYEVQNSKLNASKINIANFIILSEVGTAVGTFNTSQTLFLSTTLSYVKPWADALIFGIPYVALYQGAGTAGTNQIWPSKGSGVTAGRYDVQLGFDFADWDGVTSSFGGVITDTNGTSTQAVTLATQWWHPDYKTGESG